MARGALRAVGDSTSPFALAAVRRGSRFLHAQSHYYLRPRWSTARIPLGISTRRGRSPLRSSPPPRRALLLLPSPFRLLAAGPMAPIRRFSSEEKGEVPLDRPLSLPPKKRLRHRRDAGEDSLEARPWAERPPPGFPVPLLANVRGASPEDAAPPSAGRARSRLAALARPAGAGLHAEESPHELIVWAKKAPRTWIKLPRSFAMLMPPSGPAKLRLQHAGCRCRVLKADVEVVPSGKVFITHGWGAIAQACCPYGSSAIHLELIGGTLCFQVFNEDGRRLKRCPKAGEPRDAAPSGELALGLVRGAPSDSGRSQESDDSPETSDDSYVPPSFSRSRGWASAYARRRR